MRSAVIQGPEFSLSPQCQRVYVKLRPLQKLVTMAGVRCAKELRGAGLHVNTDAGTLEYNEVCINDMA